MEDATRKLVNEAKDMTIETRHKGEKGRTQPIAVFKPRKCYQQVYPGRSCLGQRETSWRRRAVDTALRIESEPQTSYQQAPHETGRTDNERRYRMEEDASVTGM
jgi:hypothetical protein